MKAPSESIKATRASFSVLIYFFIPQKQFSTLFSVRSEFQFSNQLRHTKQLIHQVINVILLVNQLFQQVPLFFV